MLRHMEKKLKSEIMLSERKQTAVNEEEQSGKTKSSTEGRVGRGMLSIRERLGN